MNIKTIKNTKNQLFHKGVTYYIFENDRTKICRTDNSSYNYHFNKLNGTFYRWGKTQNASDDPTFCPLGPEILDIEVSVNGCTSNCTYCYKENLSEDAYNMSFDTFKAILDKIPPVLTQIAFGITEENTNPELLKMMQYCRQQGIIPNLTITGKQLTNSLADEFKHLVGAIAVSAHPHDLELCYDTAFKLCERGLKQVNIHLVVCQENLPFTYKVLKDTKTDNRLKKINALVYLGIKPKGRAKSLFTPITQNGFNQLIETCMVNNIPYGFDSCSAPKFSKAVISGKKNKSEKERLLSLTESCESSLFSAYIDVYGNYWPCSFAENEKDIMPVDVLRVSSFTDDIWDNHEVNKFRTRLIQSSEEGIRKCILFNQIN